MVARSVFSASSSAFKRTSSSVSWAIGSGCAGVCRGCAPFSSCTVCAHCAGCAESHAFRSSDLIRHWFLLSRKAGKSADFIARMIVQRETSATCAACAGDRCAGVCALTVQDRRGWWQVSQVPDRQEMAGKGVAYRGRSVTGARL